MVSPILLALIAQVMLRGYFVCAGRLTIVLNFVTASRDSQEHFMASSMLGLSLRHMEPFGPFGLQLFALNSRSLGACFNEVIDSAEPDDILAFIHDDVSIDDWHICHRLDEALTQFDVVGVAGNRRRQAHQETWWMLPSRLVDGKRILDRWDHEFLSGAIAHGQPPYARPSLYGTCPSPVALLDGVFLAARAGRLQAAGVRFDPRLAFHHYDLDFCRSASSAGLRIGTWPIALTHASGGESVQSPAWAESVEIYLRKWGE